MFGPTMVLSNEKPSIIKNMNDAVNAMAESMIPSTFFDDQNYYIYST